MGFRSATLQGSVESIRFNLGSLEGHGEGVDFGCKRHLRNDLCVFATLVQDQEVEGSNPFAPTTQNLPFHWFTLLFLIRFLLTS